MSDWPSNQDINAHGLPFNGTLGDGRHGNATLTTQTLTELIFQYGDLTINAGQTVTAKAINPGGVIWAVRGTLTLAGTLTCNNRGAPGSSGGGKVGAGSGFAGSGGATTSQHSGSVIVPGVGALFGGMVTNDAQDASTAATNLGLLWRVLGGVAARSHTAATAGEATSASAYFDWLWTAYPLGLLGFGSGGGSEAGGDTGGNGGGCVFILCNTLNFTGTINANGGDGAGVNAGGGGGGSVIIGYRVLVANTGTINVAGGAKVGTAGAGGAGYSKVFDMRM